MSNDNTTPTPADSEQPSPEGLDGAACSRSSNTPDSARIIENIDIAIHADTREQALAHLEEAHREIENMERERNALKIMLVRIYNQGYLAGHEDTVEARFTPVHHTDMDTHHADVVAEILQESAKHIDRHE